ncbi:EboA domain-containing protein [Streptomyces sp. TRM64462]|uniref:EboA domain-containing protein n=1 Tax=Streptomyces sp. TRM64462 TaxID=2741726 RepID=UPI002814C6B5|nr:EboA domain-containing protein [Streptomyces sp. TRM64462]
MTRHSEADAPADTLADTLRARLPAAARAWLSDATAAVAERPDRVDALLAVAGRACGRGPLPGGPRDPLPGGPAAPGWSTDDAVRVLLLTALPCRGDELAALLTRLYRHGDAAERRGVLRSLSFFRAPHALGARAVPLVEDALRTNDARLVTAALGDYARRHLDPPAFHHGLLKCVFLGVPLAGVAPPPEPDAPELLRMLRDFAAERRAAGRPVPPDIEPFLSTSAGAEKE